MNIFILDSDFSKNAEYHVDRHVNKMKVEQNQIVCSALQLYYNYSYDSMPLTVSGIPYKITHKNHPCVKWAGENIDNLIWIIYSTVQLCIEHTFRYGTYTNSHKVVDHLVSLLQLNINDKINIPKKFVLAIDKSLYNNKYVELGEAIDKYRQYYINYKYKLAKWSFRDKPFWFVDA